MADLERTLQPVVEKISEGFRVLLLNGQRQVGKSTLLNNIVVSIPVWEI
jgi:AAA+ ATPase superfamily predicted ATPase